MEPVTWNYTGAVDVDGNPVAGQPWRRGATIRDVFTFPESGATAPDYLPKMDFTGCEFRMEVRNKASSAGTLMLSLSEVETDAGKLTGGGTDGTVTYWIKPGDEGSMKLVGRVAFYDIFIEYPSGDVFCIAQGQISIDLNVTEPTYD